MRLITDHSTITEMNQWIEQGEQGFEMTCSRHQTFDYWPLDFEPEPFEGFDTLALCSYLKALEEGWDSQSPLPDYYELYESPQRQPLYLQHLKQEGIIYLDTVQVKCEEGLIEMTCTYLKEKDPLGQAIRTVHHQQTFRFDLKGRQLLYFNGLSPEKGWELIPREDYLPLPCESKEPQRRIRIVHRPRWISVYDQKIAPIFQLISLMITRFYCQVYPLPKCHQVASPTPSTTFLDCLKQMHLIHYQTTRFSIELLDEWVIQPPAKLLVDAGLKPNATFIGLLEMSLDHLSSILYLKKQPFTTHEISLLLKRMDKGSHWLMKTMEKPWIQSLLTAQGTKRFCQHWFHSNRPIGELVRDIDRQYHQIQDLLEPSLFEEVTKNWSYQMSFEGFECQLIKTLDAYQTNAQKQPFVFKTSWVKQCFEMGRCLFQDSSLRLMIPENEYELVEAGKRYRMCFRSYLKDISNETMFIFFIRDINQKLQGAIRLAKSEHQWEVVEVKRIYNQLPSDDLINWIGSIAEQYGWKCGC